MADRYQVIGPPGTGKTTYLKRQVERAAASLGPAEIMVCSLTRAAAAEIKGRDLPIPADRVGTLHSFAYRALGCPTVAESKLKEWNEAHPRFRLSSSKAVRSPEDDTADEQGGGEEPGDELYEAAGIYRHERRDPRAWRPMVSDFHRAWTGWLEETGYLDFTGLIERAVEQVPDAPGRPLAMFVDEAQDMSRLEVALIMKWGGGCSTLVAVGDGAQALYTWRGADPDAFGDVGEPSHRKVLGQSWRVPSAPHAVAVRWAGRLLDGVEYLPTKRCGSVDSLSIPLRYGDGVAELVEQHLAEGEGTIMVQALCSYMLQPLIKSLREAAIPFHNPLRTSRGDWNPLGDRKGTSTKDRLLAFVTDDQDAHTLGLWLPMLQAKGVLARGAKERIKDGQIPDDAGEVVRLFESQDIAMAAFSGDLGWLCAHVSAEYRDRIAYPVKVAKRRGIDALSAEPRVMVGTIHSFKGGEADRVVVSPDLSPAAHAEHLDDLPSVRRAFYVAMTRTRDRLEILAPSSRRCVDLT